jgi:small-conductance mechanosensitive channel
MTFLPGVELTTTYTFLDNQIRSFTVFCHFMALLAVSSVLFAVSGAVAVVAPASAALSLPP